MSLTDLLHQLLGVRPAFDGAHRPERFGPSGGRARGFTPPAPRRGQLSLDVLPHVAPEVPVSTGRSVRPVRGAVRAFSGVRLPVHRLVSATYYALC